MKLIGGYKIVSLCISKLNDERNHSFVNNLNNALCGIGCRLFVYHTCSDLYWRTKNEDGEKSVFELIDYDVTDALVVFDEAFYDKDFVAQLRQRAVENGVPVISVGEVCKDSTSIVFDYSIGFEKVVRHIVEEHGVRDLHFIAGTRDNAFSDERIEVFKRVLQKNSIPFSSDMVSYGDYWSAPTQAAVKELILQNRLPRAIICANDSMAIAACTTLRENGYQVPEDVIVTGFDNIEEASLCLPPITTAGCDYRHTTEVIAQVCRKLVDGENVAPVYRIGYKLFAAGSCGCEGGQASYSSGELLQLSRDIFHRYQDDERALYELHANLMTCETAEQFSATLSSFNFYSTFVFLNREVLDYSVDPGMRHSERIFDDAPVLMFASHYKDKIAVPTVFERKKVLPLMEEIFALKSPIVFAALNYNDVPEGYMCFFFDAGYENYCKLPQYITSVNNSVNSFRNIKYQKYMAKHIEYIYKFDHLTGLYNRRSFFKELTALVDKAVALGRRISVAAIDVDGLKQINDTYGHDDGDFVIETLADAVKSISLPHKLCARFGGDELAVCAISGEDGDEQILADIEKYLESANAAAKKPYKISASIGVSVCKPQGFDFDSSYKQADEKMYMQKSTKKMRH